MAKIRVSKFMRYIVIIFLLLDNCFFNLVPLPRSLSVYMSFWNKTLIGMIALVLFIACNCTRKFHNGLIKYNGFINRYATVYVIAIVFVMGMTCALYSGTSLKSSFTTGCYYYITLMYAPILISMKDDDSIHRILKIMNIFSFVWYTIVIVQSLLYTANGNIFIQYLLSQSQAGADNLVRNSMIRISLVPFGNLMILYNAYRIIAEKRVKKTFSLVNLVMGLCCLLCVQQTRAMTAIIMACMAVLLVFSGKSINLKLRNILILIAVVIAVVNSGALDNYINTFFSEEFSGSSNAREYAIGYYGSVFLNNPIIGFGFVNSSIYDSLIHGVRGTAYIDDVGLWGQMARLGIVFFIIVVPLLIRMCKITWFLYRRKNTTAPFFLVALIYLVSTSFTLIILDTNRIMLLPFIIALFEFEYNKEKQNWVSDTSEVKYEYNDY